MYHEIWSRDTAAPGGNHSLNDSFVAYAVGHGYTAGIVAAQSSDFDSVIVYDVSAQICSTFRTLRMNKQNIRSKIVFFDQLQQLCKSKGVSMTKLVTDIGMSKSAVTYWRKTNTTPKADVLQKITDYFNVPVNYFFNEEQTSPATMTEDEELQYVLEQYRTRPCLRMLFKVSDKATAKHVYQAAEQIEALTLLENHKSAEE